MSTEPITPEAREAVERLLRSGQADLTTEALEELGKPLDPDRVRRKKGRGGKFYDYLAGHDVKRRASEIFGFGNWGSRVLELKELAVVEVKSQNGTDGWHVAYEAIVEVTVRGCLPFSDVGYGDGIEYGPAAYATARELAVKEASTDALKRAFTGWGDQFGLVLYEKADDKRRQESDRSERSTQSGRPVRPTAATATPAKPTADASKITPTVRSKLFATLTDVRRHDPIYTEEWLHESIRESYDVTSVNDLTLGQASDVIKFLSGKLTELSAA